MEQEKTLIPKSNTNTGLSLVSNLDKLVEYAKILLKSGFLPKHITSPEQVIAIIAKGKELNIPDMQALSSIYIVNGVPALTGQLMLALIRRSKLLEDFSIEYDEQGNCYVTMKRQGYSPIRVSFTWEEARALGLDKKENYIKQPATMFQWRAIAKCARLVFPDVIAGCYALEELDVKLNEEGEVLEVENTYEISDYVKSKIPNYQDFLSFDLNDYEKLSKEIEQADSREKLDEIATKIKTSYPFLHKQLLIKLREEFKEKYEKFKE